MRIAIFSDTFPPQTNGVANTVHTSARGLAELGHEVHVFTVADKSHGGQTANDVHQQENFTLFHLPAVSASFIYPDQSIGLPLGIALNKLRKIKPDVIHSHTPFAVGWEAVLSGKILHIPVVGTHHTFFDHYLKYVKLNYGWMRKISWKYTVGYYNLCNLVLSPTASLANELRNHGLKKNVKILPNSIDAELFQPAKNARLKKELKSRWGISKMSLVYMGRVSYEKSIDQLLKTVALVKKKMPLINLVIIGDGPERNNLEKLADDLDVKDNVIFTGFRYGNELAEILRASDIFLTASKSENMPLSVMEAMASGLPIIGVRALGIPELVKDNVNGFLVAPDNYQSMAQKIIELTRASKLMKKFSNASREISSKYSQSNVIKSLEKIYAEAVVG